MATRSSAITSQIISDGEYAGRSLGYGWNPISLAFEVVSIGAAGVGGGPATIADGADIAQGSILDVESAAGAGSVIALLKRLRTLLGGTLAVSIAAALDVSDRAGRALGVISGTVTANAGTNLNTSALALDATVAKDATLTGGTQKAIARGGQKGTTNTNADITHTASGANHEGLDVILYDAAGNVINPTAIRALTVADIVSATQGAAAAVAGAWPVKHTDGVSTQAVKAASTAAVAADPAAVVALSPATGLPELRASTTVNSSTAAVNTALTATLNAPGAGLFQYITSIIVEKLYSVVGVAAGAGVIITSANLGGLAWTTEQLASVAGTVSRVVDYRPTTPLKAAVANTNATIICPQQLQTIWRITVTYFIAP